MRRYPFLPLYRELGFPSMKQVARIAGVHDRQVYRWREYGIRECQADQVATHIGSHIGIIWPEYWDDVRYSITNEGRAALDRERVVT